VPWHIETADLFRTIKIFQKLSKKVVWFGIGLESDADA
jgi:hypothetical protein